MADEQGPRPYFPTTRGMKLTQLRNVRAPAPTDGQALLYNDTDGKWEAGDVPSSIGVTVDDTIAAAAANTGTLNQALSWLAKIIKGITGKADWKTAPAITLETLSAHASRHHSGGADAMSLGSVAGSLTATQHGALTSNTVGRHSNTTTAVDGFMAAADKLKLDGLSPGVSATQLTATTSGTGGADGDYSRADHRHGIPSASTLVTYLTGADGAGSSLDADLLDGQHGAFYSPTTHTHVVNDLTDFNTADYGITSSPSATITGISMIAGGGSSYLVLATVEIYNNTAFDFNFAIKFTFETTVREVTIASGFKAIVSLASAYNPGTDTAVGINLYSGAGAGAVVLTNKATLQLIQIA